jgi:hypothetical protein
VRFALLGAMAVYGGDGQARSPGGARLRVLLLQIGENPASGQSFAERRTVWPRADQASISAGMPRVTRPRSLARH